jgi:hypothetical protein
MHVERHQSRIILSLVLFLGGNMISDNVDGVRMSSIERLGKLVEDLVIFGVEVMPSIKRIQISPQVEPEALIQSWDGFHSTLELLNSKKLKVCMDENKTPEFDDLVWEIYVKVK